MNMAIQMNEDECRVTVIEIARRLGTTINLVLLVAKSLRMKTKADSALSQTDAAKLESETSDMLGLHRTHYYVDGANVLHAGNGTPNLDNLRFLSVALVELLGAREEDIHIGIKPETAKWIRTHLPDQGREIDNENGKAWSVVTYDDDLFVLHGLIDDPSAMAVSNDGYWNWTLRPDRFEQRRIRFVIEQGVVTLWLPDGRILTR